MVKKYKPFFTYSWLEKHATEEEGGNDDTIASLLFYVLMRTMRLYRCCLCWREQPRGLRRVYLRGTHKISFPLTQITVLLQTEQKNTLNTPTSEI